MQSGTVRRGCVGLITLGAVYLAPVLTLLAQNVDFGDAPQPYPTLLPQGAHHAIMAGAPWLGDSTDQPDAEGDGQPHANAMGDDLNNPPGGGDDEDGVVIPSPLQIGRTTNITVTIGGPGGHLDAWVDWNGNGVWETGESIHSGPVGPGYLVISVTPSAGSFVGRTFARFRIWDGQLPLPSEGYAENGEVEDHVVWIEEPQEPPFAWKWRQPPDFSPQGFDVECRREGKPPIVLADDFRCTERSTITNVVIWGSWLHDELPLGDTGPDPSNVVFTLSFHADVPAGVQAPWSMPGTVLWWTNFPPGSFRAEWEVFDLVEGFYDPATTNYVFPGDTKCWRYTFPIDPQDAFVQTGGVDNAVIYWLDVQAHVVGQNELARFGWKTTPPQYRWNDDACWAPAVEPYNGFWWDLHYPPGHPLHKGFTEEDSFDLAFMLLGGPVPGEEPMDFGDAPDPGYPTLAASNGARHKIVASGPWLGAVFPDAEPDGQQSPNADGDDLNPPAGPDDEDGVSIPQLVRSVTTSIRVTVNSTAGGGGFVDAWIDWSGDGVWQHPNERIFSGPLPVGNNFIPVTPPAAATNGWTFARFRVSNQGGLAPSGAAPDGEVEDYKLFVDSADWGDAPNDGIAWFYPTRATQSGAWHVIANNLCLGAAVDSEADGQPTAPADGDDLAGAVPFPPGDEDGVVFTSGLFASMPASIQVTAVGSGLLSAWLDANGDGDWIDSGEQVLVDVPLTTGTTPLVFAVPAAGYSGVTYIRFRYSTQPYLGIWFGAPDGEVEDYQVTIAEEAGELDYGDAPASYPVVSALNGARHVNASMAYAMGALIDGEPDGLPSPAADGDDSTGVADEDGVIFSTNGMGKAMLVQGSNMVVRVITPGSPWLSAWIDFNGDGDWNDGGEQIAAAVPLSPGTNSVAVTAPSLTYLGLTYARFRTSSLAMPLTTTGAAPDGEVEDYRLSIYQPQPSPATISITNLTLLAHTNATVMWDCDAALLTQPEACTNLVEASTNTSAWVVLRNLGTLQTYTDTGLTAVTSRFYRVVAPYVAP